MAVTFRGTVLPLLVRPYPLPFRVGNVIADLLGGAVSRACMRQIKRTSIRGIRVSMMPMPRNSQWWSRCSGAFFPFLSCYAADSFVLGTASPVTHGTIARPSIPSLPTTGTDLTHTLQPKEAT